MPLVGAIQMCSSDILVDNLKIASNLIRESAKNRVQLVVLPEMFPLIGRTTNDKVSLKEDFGNGLIQSFLHSQSIKHKIWIVGGTIPISCKNKDKIRASTLVYDDQGNIVARYDKIHLFDVVLSDNEKYIESDTTEPGDETVVVQTPVGKLGLAVCFDIRFPQLFKNLYDKGAEIIALPSAFTMKTGEAHWELLTRARAVESFSYIIGAAQGGLHSNGRQTFGNSLIVNPWGSIAAKHSSIEPGIIYSEIDLENLHSIRKSIPITEHFNYKDLNISATNSSALNFKP